MPLRPRSAWPASTWTAPSPTKQARRIWAAAACRSEEHTSELQSQSNLVCRLLLEKKKTLHSSCGGESRHSRRRARRRHQSFAGEDPRVEQQETTTGGASVSARGCALSRAPRERVR